MTKAELLERMDSSELTEWIAEFRIRAHEQKQTIELMKAKAKLKGRR